MAFVREIIYQIFIFFFAYICETRITQWDFTLQSGSSPTARQWPRERRAHRMSAQSAALNNYCAVRSSDRNCRCFTCASHVPAIKIRLDSEKIIFIIIIILLVVKPIKRGSDEKLSSGFGKTCALTSVSVCRTYEI